MGWRRRSEHGGVRRVMARMAGGVLLTLILLGAAAPGQAATEVCGFIASDTTWDEGGSPYVATCSLKVEEGTTLIIKPGVTVRFKAGLGLTVDGQLLARGTGAKPIVFTKDGEGNWGYIWLTDTSVDAQFNAEGQYLSGSIVEEAIIEHAGAAAASSKYGALLLESAYPFIHSTTIRNNVASGINVWGLSDARQLLFTDNAISGNTSSGNGGGISIEVVSDTAVILTNNVVSGNTSSGGSGGGIYVNGGTLSLTNNTVTGNVAESNCSPGGGGIAASSATIVLNSNRITGNTVTATYSWCAVSGNGGGIHVASGTAALNGNLISGNTATAVSGHGNGGGIHLSGGTAVLNGNLITGNTATAVGGNGYGGGIYVGSGTAVLNGNLISGNTATGTGGGGSGGGLYAQSGNPLTIGSNTIAGNSATNLGGGFYLSLAGTTDLNNNALIGNTALTASAGYYKGSINQELTSNLITRNEATGDAGVTLFLASGSPRINYNNIYGNTLKKSCNGTPCYELWNDNLQGSGTVNAESNWWGTADGTKIPYKIYDYFDDAAKSVVDSIPYLPQLDFAAPVPPPTALTATAAFHAIDLTWSPVSVSDRRGYRVYYSTHPLSECLADGLPGMPLHCKGTGRAAEGPSPIEVGDVTNFHLSGLEPDTTYYVAVTTVDLGCPPDRRCQFPIDASEEVHESWFSAEKQVTLPPDRPCRTTLSVADPEAAEAGQNPGSFLICRNAATPRPLTVSYTIGGSALNGTDYQGIDPFATILAGQRCVAIPIVPVDDALIEGPETVTLTLTAAAPCAIGSPDSATLTLAENDFPTVTLTAPDPAATESPLTTGTFRFTRTGPITAALPVSFTRTGTATAVQDYLDFPLSLTIPIGQSSATLILTPVNDVLPENPETVTLTLAAKPTYVVGTPSSATVTITSEDLPTVTLTAPDPTAAENPLRTGNFRVARTGPTTAALPVSFTRTGTATAVQDYVNFPLSLTIPIGASSATLILTPVNDATVEGPETVILTLAPRATYTVGAPATATVTITSED
jgi:hypothetical protein